MSDSTRTRTISFSDLHYELTSKLAKDHHMGFSAVVRLVYDYAIDHDPELGLLFYEDKKKALQAALASVDEMIRELEAKLEAGKTEAKVFEKTGTCNLVTSKPRDDHDEFLRYLEFLEVGKKSTPSTELAVQSIKTLLKNHPEWTKEVPTEKLHLLTGESP